MPIQPAGKTIEDYCHAYKDANGKDVIVRYEAGWFRVRQGITKTKYRESRMLSLTDVLRDRAPDREPSGLSKLRGLDGGAGHRFAISSKISAWHS